MFILQLLYIYCLIVYFQVKEVDAVGADVLVYFMTQQGQQYFWSVKPDSSWEALQYFAQNSRRTTLCLNAELSTHRKQIFEIV